MNLVIARSATTPAWLVERTQRAAQQWGWTLLHQDDFLPGVTPVLLVQAGAWWPGEPAVEVLDQCQAPVFGVMADAEWRRALSRCGGDLRQLRWWQLRPKKSPEVWYLPAAVQREQGFQLCRQWLWKRFRAGAELYRLPSLDPLWDDRPRMVQAVTSVQIGGAERVALDLTEELHALGHPCLLAVLGRTARKTYPMPRQAVDLSGKEDRLQALHEAALRFGADVLQLHLVTGVAVEELREMGWPVMLSLHNTREGWAPGMEALQPSGGSRGKILVLGCSMAVTAQFEGSYPAVPARCVWNGILPGKRNPEAAAAWRQQLGVSAEELLVLSLANARPQKRLELMPPVIEILRQRGLPAVLALAGAGTDEIARGEGVHGLGLVEDAGPLLEAADVLLNTSAHEGLSLSQLEALARGTPVVASAVGGAREVEGIVTVPPDAGPAVYADAVEQATQKSDVQLPTSFHRYAMARRLSWLNHCLLHSWTSGEGLLLVTNNFSMGGAQSSARRLLLALKARGIRVMAAVVEEEEQRPTPGLRALRDAGIEVLILPRSGITEPEVACTRLLEMLAVRPPACVVFWNLIASYKVLLADAMMDGAVRVVDVSPGEMFYDSLNRYFERPRPGRPYLSGLDYGRRLDAMVVKYEAEAGQAQRFLGCPVSVVRNGVHLPPSCEREAKPNEDKVVIGTATRLAAHKRVEDLVEAFAILHSSHPMVELHVAGGVDGRQDDYVKALKKRAHGLPVRWLGPVADVAAFHRNYDLFAMISEPAGCPNASLEAMAAGLPVVATDVGGASEQVVTGQTGILVPPRDAKALAAAMETLVTDPGERHRMGLAAREHVSQRFSMDQMVSAYLEVFQLRHAEVSVAL